MIYDKKKNIRNDNYKKKIVILLLNYKLPNFILQITTIMSIPDSNL